MSMVKLQPVRGTHDFLPAEARRMRHIADCLRAVAECYGFDEIVTPIFEFTDVFQRTLGDTSDVVTKETYSFTDRGGEQITLRPEFTAAVARAFISHGMQDAAPCKFFYTGPAFRYERPQKGRLRQFHQAGIELLGAAEPMADVEVIALAWHMLGALGLQQGVTVELNSLGDADSRRNYRVALVQYYEAHRDALSQDSKTRLEKNPLRILDSKDAGDIAINEQAPGMAQHFTPEAAQFFAQVRAGLDALEIPYRINPRLVRGLDYYSHTVFECVSSDGLGAQNTLLAGGRYDGLVAMMGGPATPGVGFAAGLERLSLAAADALPGLSAPRRPVVLIPLGDAAEREMLVLARDLRLQGLYVEIAAKGNMSKRMKRADKLAARVAVMLGEDEMAAGVVTLRDLDLGTQQSLPRAQLLESLKHFI